MFGIILATVGLGAHAGRILESSELVREVVRLHKNREVIFFLGAGVSLGSEEERAEGRGMPSSGHLAERVAAEFTVDSQGDLTRTASLAAHHSEPSHVKRFVARAFSASASIEPLRAHKALARLRPHLVVTTNYDSMCERALEAELGERPGLVFRSEHLRHAPPGRPRVVKLHGHWEEPTSLVLTGPDYVGWESDSRALLTDVTAEFQRSTCVFVGYSLSDENMRRVIGLVGGNMGDHAPKHYALIRKVDQAGEAMIGDAVRFVAGDATDFLEDVADAWAVEDPGAVDLPAEEREFYEALGEGDVAAAAARCARVAAEYERLRSDASAATTWRELGEAADEAGDIATAAGAFTEAGRLYLDAGDGYGAESALRKAVEKTAAVGPPERLPGVQEMLQRARLYAGSYLEVLEDTSRLLTEGGADLSPQSLHAIRVARAVAREAMEQDDQARAELFAALESLPASEAQLRIDLWCAIARSHARWFQWAEALNAIERAREELADAAGIEEVERKRSAALIKLVRANIHQALGEHQRAVELYEDCESAFSKTGDQALRISAMEGSFYCGQFLNEPVVRPTRTKIMDLVRNSPEHQNIADKHRQGIAAMANGKLAEARASLMQAIIGARAVHSPTAERATIAWLANAYSEANEPAAALERYVLAADQKRARETAALVGRFVVWPQGVLEVYLQALVKLAQDGSVPVRAAALTALEGLADLLPGAQVAAVSELLADAGVLLSDRMADRNVLKPAAELAEAAMPMFDTGQAVRVGEGLVEAIDARGGWWTSYKAACSALAALAGHHPDAVPRIAVPVDRLAELVDNDVINDRHKAVAALVNLALAGHEEAGRRAREILRSGEDTQSVRWRYVMGDVEEDELVRTAREALPTSINRVEETEEGATWGLGYLSPDFLIGWDLPEAVESELAETLADVVSDEKVFLPNRQAAAVVLGKKAGRMREEVRTKAIGALFGVLSNGVKIHPAIRSITHPMSVLRMNVGQPVDVVAAVLGALIAFSSWMTDDQRDSLRRQAEQLRAAQDARMGLNLARGLRCFRPRYEDETRWLRTRMLLLLNAEDLTVRRAAATSMGSLVESGALPYDAELLDMVLLLGYRPLAEDRMGAAFALARLAGAEGWATDESRKVLERLKSDPSFKVRFLAEGRDRG
jgi:tetratricopeptide (TPR) repeat protein